MPRKLRLHPGAEQDADEAAAWYQKSDSETAARFVKAYESMLTAIEAHPENFVSLEEDTSPRRATLKKFPYNVIFSIEDDQV